MSPRLLGSRARERGHHDAVLQGDCSDLHRSKQLGMGKLGHRCGPSGCAPGWYQSFEPPSTWMVVPVIQRASSDARKATTDPISAGSAMRCNACIPRMKLWPASVLAKFDISVSVTPGAIALTRIPRGPSAAAKGFTSASTAPFDAE